jgi:hypothetical protein
MPALRPRAPENNRKTKNRPQSRRAGKVFCGRVSSKMKKLFRPSRLSFCQRQLSAPSGPHAHCLESTGRKIIDPALLRAQRNPATEADSRKTERIERPNQSTVPVAALHGRVANSMNRQPLHSAPAYGSPDGGDIGGATSSPVISGPELIERNRRSVIPCQSGAPIPPPPRTPLPLFAMPLLRV